MAGSDYEYLKKQCRRREWSLPIGRKDPDEGKFLNTQTYRWNINQSVLSLVVKVREKFFAEFRTIYNPNGEMVEEIRQIRIQKETRLDYKYLF